MDTRNMEPRANEIVLTTDDLAFEHAHGYHLTRAEITCDRCLAGDLPTRTELMRALVLDRWMNCPPRKAAGYRAELSEWLEMDARLRSVAEKTQAANELP
ncbi:MAG TPA: hypothetical protein VN133_00535 [Humibacter sp.]|nr:hypothetical protein [Humibacter sp.]